MVPRSLIDGHAEALRGLSAAARADFADVWVVLDKSDPTKVREALCAYVPGLIDKYGWDAMAVAMEFYEKARHAEVPWEDFMAIDESVNPSRLKFGGKMDAYERVRWACQYGFRDDDPDAMAKVNGAVMGIIDSWVKNTDRHVLLVNARADSRVRRYFRIPAGKTCDWCLMLASNPTGYLTSDAASAASHDFCDCTIMPAWKGAAPHVEGYDPEALREEYDARLKEEYTSGEYYAKRNAKRTDEQYGDSYIKYGTIGQAPKSMRRRLERRAEKAARRPE